MNSRNLFLKKIKSSFKFYLLRLRVIFIGIISRPLFGKVKTEEEEVEDKKKETKCLEQRNKKRLTSDLLSISRRNFRAIVSFPTFYIFLMSSVLIINDILRCKQKISKIFSTENIKIGERFDSEAF